MITALVHWRRISKSEPRPGYHATLYEAMNFPGIYKHVHDDISNAYVTIVTYRDNEFQSVEDACNQWNQDNARS